MLEIADVSMKYKNELVLKKVSLSIKDGESVSMIGESGSGKSTLCRLILGLEKSFGGSILWNGTDVSSIKKKQLYRDIQPVFQDNTGCFNPRMKIGESLSEPMKNLSHMTKAEILKKTEMLLEMVELSKDMAERYPHELSGGQQKRVCIARALSINPRLLILDEAVTGLDTTVMIKILLLLKKLQKEFGYSFLFVTHDLRAALFLSRKIAVMKEGQIVETVSEAETLDDFSHPFAKKLVGSRKYEKKILEEII